MGWVSYDVRQAIQIPILTMKLKHTKVATLAATLITFGSLAGGANAAVTVHLSDGGSGSTNMSISASGTVIAVNSWFVYETLTPTFHGTANYDNIVIADIPTGAGSPPLNRLRIRDNFASGSYFQLWTGSPSVNSPFDLSSMNGTYNVPVDFSLLNEGTWTLTYSSGMDVGEVNLTVGAVPEPSSTLLLGLGALAIVVRRKRLA